MKKLLPAILALFFVAPMFFTHSCANTTQAPTGGPKDTLPPNIIDIRPLPGAVKVPTKKHKIVFTFDEYVTIKNAQNIFLSPPLEKKPLSKISGKNLVVSFESDLEENTTYTLNLGDAIADNNEGNIFPGFTYVFSTGEKIDSMYLTGMVQDCSTLDPVKGATVMLYKDHRDSAVLLSRPYAAVKTDDWGFFAIPYLSDTLYRIYAVTDENNNNLYDPDSEKIAFIDSLVRPTGKVNDTIPELLKYDMTDTLNCLARKADYELSLFRERPSKQYIVTSSRTGMRSAYVTFMAQDAWIDSLWVAGYPSSSLITQFNIEQDSLEIWVNDRKRLPDTLHLFINYRKTDSTGAFKPALEHLKLNLDAGQKKTYSRSNRRNLKHEDTVCVFNLNADPATVEQNGLELEFKYPIINESFSSMVFRYINPRQKESIGEVDIERDSMNLRRYIIRPKVKLQQGYDYFLKVPHRAFRDINGFWSDSTEVKFTLPTDETLSTLNLILKGVENKYIVDLLGEKRDKVLRSYITDSDRTLVFPYLAEGKYSIRITEDANRNSIVDAGNLLQRRQSEKVRLVLFNGEKTVSIPKSTEIDQTVDLKQIFAD